MARPHHGFRLAERLSAARMQHIMDLTGDETPHDALHGAIPINIQANRGLVQEKELRAASQRAGHRHNSSCRRRYVQRVNARDILKSAILDERVGVAEGGADRDFIAHCFRGERGVH